MSTSRKEREVFNIVTPNIGNLSHLENIPDSRFDVKSDFQAELSFQRLFKEIYQFHADNNGFVWAKRLLKQKYNNGQLKEQKLLMSHEQRKQVANDFIHESYENTVILSHVTDTATRLMLNDKMFVKMSHNYRLKPLYFPNVMALIKIQQEMILELLSNISHYGNDENEKDNQVFDCLYLIHNYLAEVSQLFILFYSLFDSNFTPIFYPWIKQAIGGEASSTIFCENNEKSENKMKEKEVELLAMIGFKIATEQCNNAEITDYKNRFITSTRDIATLKQSIYDIYKSDSDVLRYISTIDAKLNEMINDLRTQNTILLLQASDQRQRENLRKKIHFSALQLPDLVIGRDLGLMFDRLLSAGKEKDQKKFKDGFKHKDVYYNYFNSDELKHVLLSCVLVLECNVYVGLIDVICGYVGIADWSNEDKSGDISLYDSNDKCISYALSYVTEPGGDNYNTVLFDEWIDNSNSKQIYRYMFRFFVRNHSELASIFVGFVGLKWKCPLKDGNIAIGIKNKDSFAWCNACDGSSWFTVNTKMMNFRSQACNLRNNNDEEYCKYFMMEVNLIANKLIIACPAFSTDDKYMINDFPKALINQKPFRIGVSMYTQSDDNYGIGLVRINP